MTIYAITSWPITSWAIHIQVLFTAAYFLDKQYRKDDHFPAVTIWAIPI